jgi:hypothetical protein
MTATWLSGGLQRLGRRSTRTTERALAKGECLSVRGGRLRCVNGRLWVTVEGDAADYLVDAGREMALPTNRRVVVQAVAAGCVEVDYYG